MCGERSGAVTKAGAIRSDFNSLDLGDTKMGDKGGSKDKARKEQQKKAKLSPKEKRKAQKEKKNSS